MTQAFVSFEHVSKDYKWFKALHDVHFDLRQGEIFGYIGPNGAGKTTTLKLLVGLLRKFEGKISVGGQQYPGAHDQVHKLIGYLPQNPDFQQWRTVNHALLTLGLLSGVPKATLEKRIPELLERFELGDVGSKKIKKLSGGMKQKVGFIQALLHDPKLLVLDEPLAGLDPASRLKMKELILELKEKGTTVIFSSHILSDVEDVVDRLGIVHKGRTLKVGTQEELKQHFGLGKDIHIEFSQAPDNMDFLNRFDHTIELTQRKNDYWILQMDAVVDEDDVVHRVITETLAHNGKLRKIGRIAPSLDELYKRFMESLKTEAQA